MPQCLAELKVAVARVGINPANGQFFDCAGGIRGVAQWAVVAEAADKPIVIGTEWGAGLKVAAKLHLGAALPNADPVVELTEIMIHELLLKEPLQLEDGYLRVPLGPGLGLELDEAKIRAFTITS